MERRGYVVVRQMAAQLVRHIFIKQNLQAATST
jgi:hypothetical protein